MVHFEQRRNLAQTPATEVYINLTNPLTLAFIGLATFGLEAIQTLCSVIQTRIALRNSNPSLTAKPSTPKPQRIRKPLTHLLWLLAYLICVPVGTYITLALWYTPFPGVPGEVRYTFAILIGIATLTCFFLSIPVAISNLIRGEPAQNPTTPTTTDGSKPT